MRKKSLVLCIAAGLFSTAWAGEKPLRVIATTQDLADIAMRVAGDAAKVESLSTGDQDVHLVEPRPSMVMKLKRADVVVRVGLDIDMWADGLLAAARNKRVVYGAPGYVDASVGVKLLQVPRGKIDASMGDIHIFGNPHYWLDPENGKVIAKNVARALSGLRPEKAAFFERNRERFETELEDRLAGWKERLSSSKGESIVTYHNSWVYFAERFGLKIPGNIEPKPGIPPTPSHLAELIGIVKDAGVRLILVDTFFPMQGPKALEAKTGAKVLVVPSSVGGTPDADSYFALFDRIVRDLAPLLSRPVDTPSPSLGTEGGCSEDEGCTE